MTDDPVEVAPPPADTEFARIRDAHKDPNARSAGAFQAEEKKKEEAVAAFDDVDWEPIPSGGGGSFYGWGKRKGQKLMAAVLDYDVVGAKDFNGDPCPRLELELVEDSVSYNLDGDKTDLAAGDTITLTAGQTVLKRMVRRADPEPGDLIMIELINLAKSSNGNTTKEFDVQLGRGAAKAYLKSKIAGNGSKKAAKADDDDSDEPNF